MSATESFTINITSAGPAKGYTINGTRRLSKGSAAAKKVPLLVAIHGGTYTSKYFDIPGHSLMERAEALGIPIIAIDRPGYSGSTEVPVSDSIILKNAEVLDHVIGELWKEHGKGTEGVFIIGHSIGGATTTAIAAGAPSWPLLGIAISGCLLQVPSEARDQFNALPDIPYIELPSPMKDGVMFGPEWTYDSTMPGASHVSDAPIPRAELIDINNGWIDRVREVNAKVRVPVHARQAEFDHLWITDAKQASDFAASFTGSPLVDGRLVPNAGHCIDFHYASAALQLSQLGFALECAIKAQAA